MRRAVIIAVVNSAIGASAVALAVSLLAGCNSPGAGMGGGNDLTPAKAADVLKSSKEFTEAPSVHLYGDPELIEIVKVTPEGENRARVDFTWKFVRKYDRTGSIRTPSTKDFAFMLSETKARPGSAVFERSGADWRVAVLEPLDMKK